MALEKILIVGVGEIIKKLLPVLDEHISPLAWGVKGDLRKLKLTLETIQAAVSDAEKNQVNNEADRLRLRRLKDVLYDADDVIDQYSYEYMRRNEMGNQLEHKVRDFISYSSSNRLLFRFRIARQIRAINKTLDEIHEENKRYNRPNTTPGVNIVQATRRSNLESSSKGGDDSVILGREAAISKIKSMLLNNRSPTTISYSSKYSHQANKLSIVSIVGMAGLGKTTLAQLIYNESNLGISDLKAWVCVSDNFLISNILFKMIKSIDKRAIFDDNLFSLEPLVNHLSEMLNDRNFLLVLDDLWNEDSIDWEKLMKILVSAGAQSIKILITTRSVRVASVVGVNTYHLEKLKSDVCWLIMKKIVSSRHEHVPTLEPMACLGKDIAERCDGLPLAATFLGSLMALNTVESHWLKIKDESNHLSTEGYERLLSIIKLSYDNLSPPLKQCFLYCGMFPKDWVINREVLIRLWMAEGFVQPSSDKSDRRSIEDIGNDLFELLLSNSFFQDIEKDELGVIMTCKMHDTVRDLAVFLLDLEEYGILQSRDENRDASKVRRLQLVCGEGSSSLRIVYSKKIKNTEALSKGKKLRTIFALSPEKFSQINSFFSITRLRVLFPLGDWGSVDNQGHLRPQIRTLIPKLKHLRYLDLSGCEFGFMHQVSLNRCYNLLTLVLRKCKNVRVLLHDDIMSLKSLRHLDLSYSDIEVLPDSIVGLTNLHALNLHHCVRFGTLPQNIELLIHLSNLDLSETGITNLPDSITCLINLSILNFPPNLNALPTEFGALTRLIRLDVSDTKIEVLAESCTRTRCNVEMVNIGGHCGLPADIQNWPKLKHFTHRRERRGDIMPRGVEKLIYLETLDSYMVRKEAAQASSGSISHRSEIDELAALNNLQVLYIYQLRKCNRWSRRCRESKVAG